MKTQIKGRNVTVTDALQDYASEKIERVHKLLQQRKIDDVTRVELELKVHKNPSIAEPCQAEATIFTRGPVIRAHDSSTDMYAAIDLVTDKLMRRVKKYHDRVHNKTRHGHDKPALAAEAAPLEGASPEDLQIEPDADASDNGQVVKTKQFALKPMSISEAALQIELIGHSFFVFTNAETSRTNVLYRRNDGHFGLIEPVEN
jgi:putative sigma-54 modulation protein